MLTFGVGDVSGWIVEAGVSARIDPPRTRRLGPLSVVYVQLRFEGGGIAQTLNGIFGSPAPPLRQFIQGYPPAPNNILAHVLAKERDTRYPSASGFSLRFAAS